MAADDLKSHVNLYEVEMVAGLVNYLLRGGAYDQGDIAILTPYCGQLSKLHERLSATCDIWLSEKDRELLLDESLVALGAEGRATKDEVPMSDMLRIATVDNFQGEEARVIILSTVRSGGAAGSVVIVGVVVVVAFVFCLLLLLLLTRHYVFEICDQNVIKYSSMPLFVLLPVLAAK